MKPRNPIKLSVALAVVVVIALAAACSSKTTTATVASSSSPPSSKASSSSSASTASSVPTTSTVVSGSDALGGLQPLFPFATQADADAWVTAYRSGGQQPWHLDPDQTAMTFTTGFLGYTEIDTVVQSTVTGNQAHVSVGFVNPNNAKQIAATIHLVRFGSGSDAPWEVVGTDDDPSSLTVETPSYGASVGTTFEAGGHITGVDEQIVVQVRQASSETAVGSATPLPAGGEDSPWHVTITLSGATDAVLTIAAATGGHLLGVERFAVTAVRLHG